MVTLNASESQLDLLVPVCDRNPVDGQFITPQQRHTAGHKIQHGELAESKQCKPS